MKPKFIVLLSAFLLLCVLCACSGGRQTEDLDAALAGDGVRHTAYASGEADGGFHPDDDLTRGEAAGMVSALLGGASGGRTGYSDVSAGTADSGAIGLVTSDKLMTGYPDGTFRPDASMSRGEFAALVCRLFGAEGEGSPFRDIPDGYWAAGDIAAAYQRGWVGGYPDGEFHPGAPVTRAEAVVILNRALGRSADRSLPAPDVGFAVYTDVPSDHWAFYDIMEASVDHDYQYTDSPFEHWSGYSISVLGPGAGAQVLDGKLCYADPETHELAYFQKGFNTVGGELFYASQAGYAADRFPPGTMEFQGSLFCVKDDGAFLTDGDWGQAGLHFGPDGRYTSGDPEVDQMVDDLLRDVLTDDTMTQEEKLFAAYCIIRDDGFKYATRGDVYDRGSSDWTLDVARKFYKSQKGTCFYFTAGFMYLARRLGYDAYSVVGGVWSNNAYHSWVMINWPDGKQYIFDVELEWAYLHGHYSDTPKHYDLFKQPVDDALFIYNFPDEDDTAEEDAGDLA